MQTKRTLKPFAVLVLALLALNADRNSAAAEVRTLAGAVDRNPVQHERGRSEELLKAIDNDCGTCVALLLDAGVTFDPNEASSGTGISWFRYIGMSAGPKTLAAFAEHGFRLDATDDEGNTLLHRAAQGQRIDTIQWLLARGLQVDARNERGETPLMLAAYALEPNIVRALLEAKADVSLHDRDQHTAKWNARWSDHNDEKKRTAVIALLEQHGASEYVGREMPHSHYDAELDRARLSEDVTGEIYEQLPTLGRQLRFFRVALKDRKTSRLFAVLPGARVVGLKSGHDFSQLGMQLKTGNDALQFTRFLTSYQSPSQERPDYDTFGPNCRPSFPASDHGEWSGIAELLRAPQVEQRGSGEQALYVVRRILSTRGPQRHAVPVEETVSANGAYAIRPLQPQMELYCEPVYAQ